MDEKEARKQRIIKAMEKFNKKHDPTRTRRTNQKPEKDVQDKCLEWMRSSGWEVEIIEAKATFDPKLGIWRNQAVKAGYVDCTGNDSTGHAVAVEFKAPGKLKTLRDKQREFLVRKIESGCFGVVVDSAALLEKLYHQWLPMDRAMRIKFLLGELPPEKVVWDESELF